MILTLTLHLHLAPTPTLTLPLPLTPNQAIQRGKKARKDLEEMRATGKALEVKELEIKDAER